MQRHRWILRSLAVAASCVAALGVHQFTRGQNTEIERSEAPGAESPSSEEARFQTTVLPFIQANCVNCHNAEDEWGTGLDLTSQQYQAGDSISAHREIWELVAEKIHSGEMPPPGEPRPDKWQQQTTVTWLNREFDRLDASQPIDPGRITARRLNRTEYNNTVRDLLGVNFQPAEDFPPDDSGYGFDNNGDVLTMSPLLMEKYLDAASTVARRAIYGIEKLEPKRAQYQPWFIHYSNSSAAPHDYDETGMSLPSALHVMHHVPVDGEYQLWGLLRGSRPNNSAPVEMAYWIDGELIHVGQAPVPPGGEVSGAFSEFRTHLTAGEHWFSVSIMRQYEGLPPEYNGPNPIRISEEELERQQAEREARQARRGGRRGRRGFGNRPDPNEPNNVEVPDPDEPNNVEVPDPAEDPNAPTNAEQPDPNAPTNVEQPFPGFGRGFRGFGRRGRRGLDPAALGQPDPDNDPNAPTNVEVPDPADDPAVANLQGRRGARGRRGRGRRGRGRGGRGGFARRLRASDAFFVSNLDIIGPFTQENDGPTQESLEKIYVCEHGPGAHEHTDECASTILANLARRAYRRPATDAEVAELMDVYRMVRADGEPFEEGLVWAIQKILISPAFLFRMEDSVEESLQNTTPVSTTSAASDAGEAEANVIASATRISPHELATRLSYFLWSSMPDKELSKAADDGSLHDPQVLEAQVRRMLADPKADALVENFAGQWLQFRALESHTPEREIFQEFTEYTRMSMQKESELFFAHIMREDRSVLELLDADYTFLNQRLAEFYGIPDVYGHRWQRVELPEDSPRGGILTQGSVLTVSSYATRTSPVIRGKWVLENLLNTPPPDPPDDVPPLDEEAVGTTASLREQLEQHRSNPACASCHARMDPIGFGLENFDAIGQWRTEDGEFEIDPSGTLPNGMSFNGPSDLKKILLASREQFAECITEKMLIYALGRGVLPSDRRTIKSVAAQLAENDYRFSSLVLGIVNSIPFQYRRAMGDPL